MLLTVSVGNSRTAFAVHAPGHDGVRASFQLHTDPRRTADELRLAVGDLLARDGLARGDIDAACICSVVPAATPVAVAACRALFGVRPLVVGRGVPTGLAVRYRPATALGADRLVDAVAAQAVFGAPVVAVDFGTATTINVVDAEGAFVGGAIAPGIGLAAEALADAGARLSRVDLRGAVPPLVGRTTEAALQSGLIHGQAALVGGLLERTLRALLPDDRAGAAVPVVATGGWSPVVAPLVPRIGHVMPGLIHDGLRHVWARQPARRSAA